MSTQSDTISGDINLKGVPDNISGVLYVSSSDSDPITPAQHDATFNNRLAFPLNLTCMLESVESKGYSHVFHWSQSGNSFVICNADLLLSDVLPLFFK